MKFLKPLIILTTWFGFINFSILFAQENDTLASEIESLVENPTPQKGYIVLKKDTLFSVDVHLGPYTAVERAQAINKRLEQLSKRSIIRSDSFYISDIDNYTVVYYADTPLLYVNQVDAVNYGKTRKQTAIDARDILKKAFTDLTDQRKASFWLKKIGLTALTLLGLILIFWLINKGFDWVNKKLLKYEAGIKRKRKGIIRYLLPRNTNHALLLLSKAAKIVLYILILFLYLPLLFSFLPWTAGLVDRFYVFLAVPVRHVLSGLVQFLPNLFYIFIIILIARYIIRFVTYISKEIEEERLVLKGFHHDWAKPTFNILKILLYAFTLVFIFPYLPGSDSPAFKGVSIFLGVLFSLGSTSAISNIIAGIVITYMRPFIIGDRVQIGDSIGDIVEKNMLVTRLKTVKNEDITIPNAQIINAHLKNYTKYASSIGIILHPTVTIGYDVPSELVNKLLLKAAQNTKNLTREFKPFVLQKSLDDFYVEYELNVYTKQPKMMAQFYSELNKAILHEFNEAGVEILSPHYSAFRDGNASTLPSEQSAPTNPVEQVIDKVSGKK
jgi:small-conductance mechanosensitive channel